MTNKQSAEHNAPRLLRDKLFLKLHKNMCIQVILRVFENDSAGEVPPLILAGLISYPLMIPS